MSAEGTTVHGDPLAMGLYALSIHPLITSLQAASIVKQCWFADDATGAGSIMEIRTWWDALIAPLVQILVIFRTTGNAGSLQNQLRMKGSGKLSRTCPLM